MAKAKIATKTEQELNRWCIEMAAKWPTVTTYGGHGVYSAGGGLPPQQADCDLIGRATKIRTWVTGSH